MRSKWTRIVLGSIGATMLVGASGFAQTGSTDEGKRKVKTKVAPALSGPGAANECDRQGENRSDHRAGWTCEEHAEQSGGIRCWFRLARMR